ncbi:MAG: hypothetical protein ABSG77_07620 [Candidatus Acidiferrum sp.]
MASKKAKKKGWPQRAQSCREENGDVESLLENKGGLDEEVGRAGMVLEQSPVSITDEI